MKPKRCRTDLPGAKQLPAPGKMERCPQCNPGMMLIPGVGCQFCKNDEYSDGASPCEKCPVSTSPQIGYTYKWWNSMPPNVTSHCFNFEGKVFQSSFFFEHHFVFVFFSTVFFFSFVFDWFSVLKQSNHNVLIDKSEFQSLLVF